MKTSLSIFLSLIVISCQSLEPAGTKPSSQDQAHMFGKQVYMLTSRLVASKAAPSAEILGIKLNKNPEVLAIIHQAEAIGIKKWIVIRHAHEIAQKCDGTDALTTKTLESARNKEWRYWFETYKSLFATAATGITCCILLLQAKRKLLPGKTQIGGSCTQDTTAKPTPSENTITPQAANPTITSYPKLQAVQPDDTGTGVGIHLLKTDGKNTNKKKQAKKTIKTHKKNSATAQITPAPSVVAAPSIYHHVMPTTPDTKNTKQPQPSSDPVLNAIVNDPQHNTIWKEVCVPEEYKLRIVNYAIYQRARNGALTLNAAAANPIQARILVWSTIANEYELTLAGDTLSASAYWFWPKDPDNPFLRGNRQLTDQLASFVFNDFYKARNPQQQKNVMLTLVDDYKIHLMPIGDPSQVFMKLFTLIKETPQLQEDIWAIKVNSKYDDTQLKSVASGSAAARPKIVIYPATGKAPANRVLNTIYTHFKDDPGLAVAPRFNQRITDLIYIAQGNGDDKVGNNLDYFKGPDYVYFDKLKVAQELEVDPSTLDFELIISEH